MCLDIQCHTVIDYASTKLLKQYIGMNAIATNIEEDVRINMSEIKTIHIDLI